MRTILIATALALCLAASTSAQDTNMSGPVTIQETSTAIKNEDGFRRALIRAMRQRVKNGDMTRRDAVKLRVALVSPAFREHCETLAITQMVFSGVESDALPFDQNGKLNRADINWEGLAAFLERLLPLLLELLNMFGA